MTYGLLVPIIPFSSDPLKVGAYTHLVCLSEAARMADAAVIRPKHLNLGGQIIKSVWAVCLSFDPHDADGHQEAWRTQGRRLRWFAGVDRSTGPELRGYEADPLGEPGGQAHGPGWECNLTCWDTAASPASSLSNIGCTCM